MSFTHGGATPQLMLKTTATPDPIGNITAGATVDVSFTVPTSTPDMVFYIDAPSLEAGLGIVRSWCGTAGTVKVRLANFTAATVTPALQTFRIIGF